MRQRHKTRESGFTLIELMVTIAVLSILLVAAAPSFADFFERYRLRSAVDDTVNLLAAARQGAVEQDRNVKVTVGGTTTDWCVGAIQQTDPATAGELVETDPAPCDCTSGGTPACLLNGEQLVINGAERPGVSLSAVGTEFSYDSKNGTLSDIAVSPLPSVAFLSSSTRYGLQLEVSPLGQARVCSMTGKRPIPGFKSC